jgi:oxygen-independent coproporphyrinogen-3 oxidase
LPNSELPISLYLHVPFCRSKCLYCDFYSLPHEGNETARAIEARVVAETLNQFEYFSQVIGSPRLQTIFFGGGTPSILSRESLRRLLEAFGGFSPSEWTVEANPESIDVDFLDLCAGRGVTRISMGVQSNRDHLLERLKRPGRARHTMRAMELLEGGWKGQVNLDFLAGIPGQTEEDLRIDLETLAGGRRIDHVSLYCLTVEPATELAGKIREGAIRPNSAERDEELWFSGAAVLESMGYSNYEISNFARPGRECRHNIRYWRLDPYLGVGPGAVSTLPAPALAGKIGEDAREAPVLRLANPRSLDAFLSGPGALWGIEVEAVSAEDFLLETLMMGFRMAEGLGCFDLQRRFGRDFEELFPGLWRRWEEEGLAEPCAVRLRLTKTGRFLLDRLLAQIERFVHGEKLPPLTVQWP